MPAPSDTAPTPVDAVIIGAGLTGLTLAHTLRKRGKTCIILEKESMPGGNIRSENIDGFLCEAGPNSMLIKSQQVEDFIAEAGLSNRITEALPEAKNRYIVRNAKLHAVPTSPATAIRCKLWSTRAKLRVCVEPFIAKPNLIDESVASFVTRRLGPEFLEYAIAPMVSGIFAGDPQKLSIRHAFPKVWNLEDRSGSLIRGGIRLMRERKKNHTPRYRSRLISFDNGLATLTNTLAATLAAELHLSSQIQSIHYTPQGWLIRHHSAKSTQTTIATHLYLTIPVHAWCHIPFEPSLQASLNAIPPPEYPPLSTLVLGYRREQIAHPLDGFGMLIPRSENRSILGSIFSSSLFPNRAPDNCVNLMQFIGGATQPELADIDDKDLLQKVTTDLRKLLGIHGDPIFSKRTFWPKAIPQYNVGHGAFLAALADCEQRFPGLHLQGNHRGGPGLNDCIESALNSITIS